MTSKPSTDASLIIFLVHGTFARGAAWTKPDSTFCTQLKRDLQALGHEKIRFELFEWSGDNTHPARREAAVKLERALRASVRLQPECDHFVVAHSHGGNIALRAVQRSRYFSEKAIGVVTLATPFLKFSKLRSSHVTWPIFLYGFVAGVIDIAMLTLVYRFGLLFAMLFGGLAALGKSLFEMFSMDKAKRKDARETLIFVPLIGLGLFLLFWLSLSIVEHWGPTPGHWLAALNAAMFGDRFSAVITTGVNLILLSIALLFVIYMAYLNAIDEVSWQRRRGIVRLRREIFRRYAYSQPESEFHGPLLSLSSSVDEALGALFGAWMMHRWTSWVVRSGIVSLVLVVTVLTIYLTVEWAQWFTEAARHTWLSALMWDTGTEVVFIVGFIIMSGFVWLSTWIFSKLVGHSNIGLGLANPDYNLLWRIRAQRLSGLSEDVENRRYSFKEIVQGSEGLLFHSRLYSHPRAIRRITGWMHDFVDKGVGAK